MRFNNDIKLVRRVNFRFSDNLSLKHNGWIDEVEKFPWWTKRAIDESKKIILVISFEPKLTKRPQKLQSLANISQTQAP